MIDWDDDSSSPEIMARNLRFEARLAELRAECWDSIASFERTQRVIETHPNFLAGLVT